MKLSAKRRERWRVACCVHSVDGVDCVDCVECVACVVYFGVVDAVGFGVTFACAVSEHARNLPAACSGLLL